MNKLLISIIIVGIIIIGIAAFFILQKPTPPSPPISDYDDSPFGAHGAFSRPFLTDDVGPEEVLKILSELKDPYRHVEDVDIKWIRTGIDIYWVLVQPTPEDVENGVYDWGVVDNLYGRVPSGVNVLANICAGRQGIKPGTWEFVNKETEEKYLNFVNKVVERYDGNGIDDMPGLKNPIRYWQIENEPALFYELRLDWQGFSHLVEITYKAIKESEPEAKIALGGLAGGNEVNNTMDPLYPLFKRQVEEFYLPLLNHFKGKYIDVFDIHYYFNLHGWPDSEIGNWKDMEDIYLIFRKALDENGYKDTEIWFTETAVPSKPYGEKTQAISLIKRYIYPLSFGVKKIFWWNMIEGETPLEDNQPSDHFGLIYDGIGADDPGYGTKKLSYYTYKKMVEILEGSDWDNIQTIKEEEDAYGIYLYKFIKNNKLIYIGWYDCFDEQKCSRMKINTQVTISDITSNQVKITEAVPKYESGEDVTDYNTAFNTEIKKVSNGKVTITLGETPVFVEEK